MINILGIIAALFLAASIYFGLTNQKSYQTHIDSFNKEERLLKKANITITDKQNTTKTLTQDIEDDGAALTTLKSDADDIAKELKEIEEEVDSQKSEIGEKKEELAELEEESSELDGVEDFFEDVKEKEGALAKTQAEIGFANTRRDQLGGQSSSVESQINAVSQKIDAYSSQSSPATLNSSIARVYGNYGFVTINGGDSAGIIKGSTLDILRGGERIGKVLVTTVEPNLAAADIISESLIGGAHFHSGDKVVSGAPFVAKN